VTSSPSANFTGVLSDSQDCQHRVITCAARLLGPEKGLSSLAIAEVAFSLFGLPFRNLGLRLRYK
jgi:hypothetical protein